MSKEEKPSDKDAKVDKELSDLLDSALDDFSKDDSPKETPKVEEVAPNTQETEVEVWSEEFIKQAAAQFENNMAALLGESGTQLTNEQLAQSFQKMAEAASQVLANPTELSTEGNVFASTITQTLQGLSEGTENLQNPFNEETLMNMFGASANGDQNAFLPFMQGMMQSLLSKEVLYPSLKDILEKYPGWLEENKEKISTDEYDRYKKQQELMEQVCTQLEQETSAVTDEQKREQFEKVLSLMQKLQDLGQPPTELVGEGLPAFDPQSSNIDPNQCNNM